MRNGVDGIVMIPLCDIPLSFEVSGARTEFTLRREGLPFNQHAITRANMFVAEFDVAETLSTQLGAALPTAFPFDNSVFGFSLATRTLLENVVRHRLAIPLRMAQRVSWRDCNIIEPRNADGTPHTNPPVVFEIASYFRQHLVAAPAQFGVRWHKFRGAAPVADRWPDVSAILWQAAHKEFDKYGCRDSETVFAHLECVARHTELREFADELWAIPVDRHATDFRMLSVLYALVAIDDGEIEFTTIVDLEIFISDNSESLQAEQRDCCKRSDERRAAVKAENARRIATNKRQSAGRRVETISACEASAT
jgi:hypothetical protein